MINPLTSLTATLSLLIALPLVYGQTAPTNTIAPGTPTGCPAFVGIENGNFGSGELAPWATPSAYTTPEISIVSSGYKDTNALQLEFPAANETVWFFIQSMGLQCEGSQYFTSFAVNWAKFSPLHGDPSTNFCQLTVESSYCFDESPGVYNATSITGWQTHSFLCTAEKTGFADLVVNFGCEADYDIPASTVQLTNFEIDLVGDSINATSLKMKRRGLRSRME